MTDTQMSDERIERAAIALWIDEGERAGPQSLKRTVALWHDNSDETHSMWRRMARIALNADAPALEAARAEGLRIARGIVQRKIGAPDCDSAIYDNSCGAWECSTEIRGYDCLCADRLEQAEAIVAAIDARLSEMDRQSVNEGG